MTYMYLLYISHNHPRAGAIAIPHFTNVETK